MSLIDAAAIISTLWAWLHVYNYTRTQLIQEIESGSVAEDATAEFVRQMAALSGSTTADDSDPFADMEDEEQLETNELIVEDNDDEQD